MLKISKRERSMPVGVIGKLLKIAAEEPKVISLSAGEPDFITPYPILNKIPDLIKKRKKNRVTKYTNVQGLLELREAITKKLKQENKIKTNPDEIFVGTGSEAAIFGAFLATLDPKSEVILPVPTYMSYEPAIKLLNAKPNYVKLKEKDNFQINPDDIKKKITKKNKVIILNTPSNPTGTVISKKILEEIADIAVDNDSYIFSDEAYEKLIYDGKKHHSIGSFNGMKKRVLTFQTFSKAYAMCGFRVGYVQGPKKLIKAITDSMTYVNVAGPTLSQHLAIEALKMRKWHVNRMVKKYDKRRKYIVKRLNEIGLRTHMPQGAFYAFSNIKDFSKDSLKFSNKLLKKAKVATVPGVEFGKAGEGYIRFSYAASKSSIRKAMNRIEKVL